MSSRKQSQILSALFWVVIASGVGAYAYLDHKKDNQKKQKAEQAKLLFQLNVDVPQPKKHDHKGHDHKSHKKDKTNKKKLEKSLKLKGITALTLFNGNAKKGKQLIELKRKGPKYWEVVKPVHTPGDLTNIGTILSEIVTAKHKQVVTEWKKDAPKDEELKKYGLSKPKHKLTFTFKKLSYTIAIGNKNKYTGSYYAYIHGSKKIVLVDSSMFFATDKKLFSLRRKEIFTQRTNEIALLSVRRSSDQLVFKRHHGAKPSGLRKKHSHGHGHKKSTAPAKEWLMTLPLQAKTDATTVNSLVRLLQNLRASAFPSEDVKKDAKKFGLDKPAVTVEVILNNKTKMVLNISEVKKGKKTKFYAASAKGGPIARVDKYILKELRKSSFDYRLKRILLFQYDKVRGITITKSTNKPFQLLRIGGKKETWRILFPSPRRAKKASVEKLLNGLRDLKTLRFVKEQLNAKELAQFGLDKPAYTIALQGSSTKQVMNTLYIGNKNKAGNYLVTNQDKSKLFEAKSSAINSLGKAPWQYLPKGKPPKRRKTVPAKRAVAPAKRVVAPAKRVVAPAKRAVAPAKRAVAPAKRVVAPAKRVVAPAKRVAAPAKR